MGRSVARPLRSGPAVAAGGRSRRGPTPRGRRGFTLVDLVTVLAVATLVAGLALPFVGRAALLSRAASVSAAMDSVATAARSYRSDTGRWPDDGVPGRRPPELLGYLADDIATSTPRWELRWVRWPLPGREVPVVGVELSPRDPALGRAVLRIRGAEGLIRAGGTWLYLVEEEPPG